MEAGIMSQLDEIVFAHVVIVNGFGDVTDATTESKALINHSNVALKHRHAIILANNIWVIGVNAPIVHIVLDVEESNHSKDINNNTKK